MALPIIIPAAEGAAALAGTIGLTAAAGLAASKPNWYKPEPLSISPQQKLELAKFIATHGLPKETNVVDIPAADNALVLRPEYRTEVTPVTYNDLIMGSRLGDAWGVLRGKKQVKTEDTSGSSESQENPKPENPKPENPKNNNKKPFWKSGLGKTIKWTVGLPAGYYGLKGIVKGGAYIGNWIEDEFNDWRNIPDYYREVSSRNDESKKENSKDSEITDADREWAAQFYTK